MPLFPEIPLLERVIQRIAAPQEALKYKGFVCVQHLLETTGSLFEHLIGCGVDPKDILVLGKPYSTCDGVVAKLRELGVRVLPGTCAGSWGMGHEQVRREVDDLWSKARALAARRGWRGIIVLDDGGLCAAGVPGELRNTLPIMGVEQTMAGAREPYPVIPVVEVASSAAKTLLEPPMIREAVLARLASRGYLNAGGKTYGVVGIGNIGKAIARGLVAAGHTVYVYDAVRDVKQYHDVPGAIVCERLEHLFRASNFIFGCTGTDILAGHEWWRGLEGAKTLVSCSSHDSEFCGMLLALNELPSPPRNLLADVVLPLEKGQVQIIRGGCPANFDGTFESVPLRDIQMTRALLLAGIFQAAKWGKVLAPCDTARLMLSVGAQRAIAADWLERRGDPGWYSSATLAVFDSIETIAAHSGGTPIASTQELNRAALRRAAIPL
jgi:hypothetical protein